MRGVEVRFLEWRCLPWPSAVAAHQPAPSSNPPVAARSSSPRHSSLLDRYYDATGKLARAPGYRKFETAAYVDYGVTEWLTVLFAPSLKDVHAHAPATGGYQGFGVTEAGARIRLWAWDQSILSVQATVRAPGSFTRRNPWAGEDAQTGADVRLLYGRSFTLLGMSGFIDGAIGYRRNTLRASDELRLDATVGLRPVPPVLLLLQTFTTLAEWNAANGARQRTKTQASVVYDVTPLWSAQVGVLFTPLGRRETREQGVFAAVWRRFGS